MYERETAFILGAGASWHYGYPTGLDLIERAIKVAKGIAYDCDQLSSETSDLRDIPEFFHPKAENPRYPDYVMRWKVVGKFFKAFVEKLERQNPLVIDYFLTNNATGHDIGRLVIAWVILEFEACSKKMVNPNRPPILDEDRKKYYNFDLWKQQLLQVPSYYNESWRKQDDWLRIICHTMLSGCANSEEFVEGNKVNFITFNYDVSLEYFLHHRFCNVDILKDDLTRITDFLADRITHVYGQIRKYPDQFSADETFPTVPTVPGRKCESLFGNLTTAYKASREIEVISAVKQKTKSKKIQTAIQKIAKAQDVYILGYGFDQLNNQYLELEECLKNTVDVPYGDGHRHYYWTNFEDSRKVRKAVFRVLGVPIDEMPPKKPDMNKGIGGSNGKPQMHFTWDVSTKNVYRALSEDFE